MKRMIIWGDTLEWKCPMDDDVLKMSVKKDGVSIIQFPVQNHVISLRHLALELYISLTVCLS